MQLTKGFTLIELLMVVVIIGILMTIALPKYQVTVDKARYTQLQVIVDALSRAEESFYDRQGKYTNKLDALSIDFEGKRWEKANMSNSSGQTVELDRLGSIWMKDGYVTIDYVEGYTPDGDYRNDGYVYAINSDIGVEYVRWLNHPSSNWGNIAGQRYCVAYHERKRGHNVCKALGGKNVTSPSWANNPDRYLLP